MKQSFSLQFMENSAVYLCLLHKKLLVTAHKNDNFLLHTGEAEAFWVIMREKRIPVIAADLT